MQITEVKTFLVEGIKYNWTLVKVETDAGIHGWGEGTNWPGSPLIEAACRHAGERIIGLDPRRIDFLWTKLYRDNALDGPGGAAPLGHQRHRHRPVGHQGQGVGRAYL